MAEWGVGAKLRSIRLGRGLTLEQLAEASGVSVRGISDIERGVRDRPRRSTIDALSDALQLDATTRRELAREQIRHALAESPAEAVQPHRLQDFVGRDAEFRTISEHFQSARSGIPQTAIIAGPPGVGKTALAIEAAQRLREPGDVPLFLDLLGPNPALARPPLSVLQALLREAFDPEDGDPPSTMGPCIVKWQEVCARRSRIIVLDNAAEEAQIRPVLAGGNLRVIITARRSLAGLENVERIHLDPLPAEESIRLLHEIVPPGQRTDQDVIELARLCSDLPLALRIAGNRIASQPAQTMADFVHRLRSDDRRLRVLVAGDLSAEAAFRVSYDDLDPFTARVFRNLCLIYGLMFEARVAAVLMDAPVIDVEDSLDELVELGLLELIGRARYRLHDLIRVFSANELRREDEEAGERAQARLRDWLLATAALAGSFFDPARKINPADVPEWMPDHEEADRWLRRNADKWWAALQDAAHHGRNREVVDVADALRQYADTWMAWNSWQDLYLLSVAAARSAGDKHAEATQLCHLAWADLVEQDDPASALARAQEANAAAKQTGDDLTLGRAALYEGWALNSLGDHRTAVAVLADAATAFERAGYAVGAEEARNIADEAARALDRLARE
jgi:transcriptional regulator with XRE-family HTH domain